MKSHIENLAAGTLKTISEESKREAYLAIREALLSQDEKQNTLGVLATKAWKAITGRNPEAPGITEGTPPTTLSGEIRSGTLPLGEKAKKLFESLTGEPAPGTGPRSKEEIQNEDFEAAFEASGFQTGREPNSQDEMAVEMLGGEAPKAGIPDNPEPVFGPVRLLKAAMTENPEELEAAAKECESIGMLEETKERFGETLPLLEQAPDSAADKIGNLFGKEIGSPSEKTLGAMADLLKEEKGRNEKMGELAGAIAGSLTYNTARSKGFKPGEACTMAKEAAGTARECIGTNPQSNNKELEGLKGAKNMTAKALSKLALAIPAPGLGKVVSVAITVADKASDWMIDQAKSDPDKLEKGSELGESFKRTMTKTKGGLVSKMQALAPGAVEAGAEAVQSNIKSASQSKKPEGFVTEIDR